MAAVVVAGIAAVGIGMLAKPGKSSAAVAAAAVTTKPGKSKPAPFVSLGETAQRASGSPVTGGGAGGSGVAGSVGFGSGAAPGSGAGTAGGAAGTGTGAGTAGGGTGTGTGQSAQVAPRLQNSVSVPASPPGRRISVASGSSSSAAAFALSGSGTVQSAVQGGGPAGWSSFSDLPGGPSNAVSAPAAVANADGHLEVLVRLADGQIADGWQSSGGWRWDGAVTGGALPGTAVGDPSAIRLPDGRVALFTRLSDGSVVGTAQTQPNGTEGWAGWSSIGGSLAGDPVPFVDQNGNVDVFGISTSGTLVLDVWNGGGWSGWGAVGAGPGNLTDDPTPVADASGGTEVFVTTTAGDVDHVWVTPGNGWVWGVPLAPDPLGAPLVGTVGALRWSDGHVEVFARLADGRVAHAWQNSPNGAAGWSGWGALPGSAAGDLTAYRDPRGTAEILFLASSSRAADEYWRGSQWSDPVGMPGSF